MKPAGEALRIRRGRINSLGVALACASLLFAGTTLARAQAAAQVQAQQRQQEAEEARERQQQAQEAAQQRQQEAEEARERQQQAQEAAQQRQQQAEEARERQQRAQEAAQQRQQQAEEARERQQQAQEAAQQRQQQQEQQAAQQRQQQAERVRQQEAEAQQRRTQQDASSQLHRHLPEPADPRPQLPVRTVDIHPEPVRPDQPRPVLLPPGREVHPIGPEPGRGFEPSRPLEIRPVVSAHPVERPVFPVLDDRQPAPIVLVRPPSVPLRTVIVGGRIRPAARPVVVAPAVVIIAPQRAVHATSVTAVLALGNVQPGNNAFAQAQAQVRAAQVTCAQATQFANTVNGQAASSQALDQGVDQMLQLLADNTSDPNAQAAITANIGQPDPINDALQQQLQNLAQVSAQNCETQSAAAQQAISAAEGNSSSPAQDAADSGSSQPGYAPASYTSQPPSSGYASGPGVGQSVESAPPPQAASDPGEFVSPANSNCLRQFYDPRNYNWLSAEDTCPMPISITFAAKASTSIWGSMDLQPGQPSSTGQSAKEIAAAGGIVFYVCPAGYAPVDPQGDVILGRAVSQFRCKRK